MKKGTIYLNVSELCRAYKMSRNTCFNEIEKMRETERYAATDIIFIGGKTRVNVVAFHDFASISNKLHIPGFRKGLKPFNRVQTYNNMQDFLRDLGIEEKDD